MTNPEGIQLAELQGLVQYWGNGYNWRKVEAKLNTLPEFVTTIDGVDIQFIHVRSREPNALPLILTHGWPGSPPEFLKVIGPLTDPVAYGGRAQDAFDVVIPAIPGYGFSGKPTDLALTSALCGVLTTPTNSIAGSAYLSTSSVSPSSCSWLNSLARPAPKPKAMTNNTGNSTDTECKRWKRAFCASISSPHFRLRWLTGAFAPVVFVGGE